MAGRMLAQGNVPDTSLSGPWKVTRKSFQSSWISVCHFPGPWMVCKASWVGQEIGGSEFYVVEDNLTTFCCHSLICIKILGYILYVLTCLFEMGTFSL